MPGRFTELCGRLLHVAMSYLLGLDRLHLFPLLITDNATDLSPAEDLVVRQTPHDRPEDNIIDCSEVDAHLANMSD